MIVLNIYVVTIIFAIVAMVLMFIESILYTREHGIVSAQQSSLARKTFDWLKMLITCCFPLWNIFVGCCWLAGVFNENVMEQAVSKSIEQGKLKYKEEGS